MYSLDLYYRINAWLKGITTPEDKVTYAHFNFKRDTPFTKEEFETTNKNMIRALVSSITNPPILETDIVLIDKEEYLANIDKSIPGLQLGFSDQEPTLN